MGGTSPVDVAYAEHRHVCMRLVSTVILWNILIKNKSSIQHIPPCFFFWGGGLPTTHAQPVVKQVNPSGIRRSLTEFHLCHAFHCEESATGAFISSRCDDTTSSSPFLHTCIHMFLVHSIFLHLSSYRPHDGVSHIVLSETGSQRLLAVPGSSVCRISFS